MATAFITGVNGFIGAHLARLLLERGDTVIGMVRATSDTRSLAPLFERHRSRLRLVIGDVREPDTLGPGLAEAEYVYHLGAVLLGVSESEFRETNVTGTRNLLEAVVRERGQSFRRFLYVSSLAAAGPCTDGTAVEESRPPAPMSWYGHSKADAERVVAEFAGRGLPVTVVRPVAVYGEREQELSRGLYAPIRMGLAPRIGLRRKTVSMVYVGELVTGFVAAAESPAALGNTYFLADPVAYRDTDLVRAVAEAFGTRVRIPVMAPHGLLWLAAVFSELAHRFTRARPALTRDKVREMRQRCWVGSPRAAGADFGWTAAVSLGEGMRRSVADWRARQQSRRLTREPLADRALKTYAIATAFGVVVEGLALLGRFYAFDPRWLIVVVVLGVFGGVMGTVSLLTAGRSPILQFVLGVLVSGGAEVLNSIWLHAWEFDPAALARLPADAWMRALVLGLPAGLMPIVVNGLVQALYDRRLRLG